MKRTISGVLIVLVFFLGGCSNPAPPPPDNPPDAEIEPTPTATPPVFEQPPPEDQQPLTLRIWLTSEFDPGSGTAAGEMLRARLEEFGLLHPGIRIETRIKAAYGPGGMLDSLSATQAAAPQALPDLVLIPRPVLEVAAARQLLFPFDAFEFIDADTDWYDYVAELARYNGLVYGVPFAYDALVLLYRPDEVGQPPRDWTTTLQLTTPLAFPAGSPQQLFTLALYQAAGGKVHDAQGRLTLAPATLASVFRFYRQALDQGVLQPRITTYIDEEDSLQALTTERAALAVAWVSQYFQAPSGGLAAVLLPTPGGVPFTYVDGWAWALSNPESDHQEISAQLAQFMSDSAFLARWTAAAGYLPARPSALSNWPESASRTLAEQIVLAAHPIPDVAVLNTLGPAIQQPMIELFRGNLEPVEAAEEAVRRLDVP